MKCRTRISGSEKPKGQGSGRKYCGEETRFRSPKRTRAKDAGCAEALGLPGTRHTKVTKQGYNLAAFLLASPSAV